MTWQTIQQNLIAKIVALMLSAAVGSYAGNMVWRGQVSEKVDGLTNLRAEDQRRNDREHFGIVTDIKEVRTEIGVIKSDVAKVQKDIAVKDAQFDQIMKTLDEIKAQNMKLLKRGE